VFAGLWVRLAIRNDAHIGQRLKAILKSAEEGAM
jgi:hypothetical protein